MAGQIRLTPDDMRTHKTIRIFSRGCKHNATIIKSTSNRMGRSFFSNI
ncbi:hypothetical protein QJL41_15275 [Clostridioides difficile]|nr:hypothetical protein [Clostridioides difficile]MDK3169761.1 hypothetical protein [Clostridioides difficile]